MGGERDPARSNVGLFDGESLEEGAELPPPDPPLPVGAALAQLFSPIARAWRLPICVQRLRRPALASCQGGLAMAVVYLLVSPYYNMRSLTY